MLLVSALWLAVVQALAPLAVPAALQGPVDGRLRVASVAASLRANSAEHARPHAADIRLRALLLGDEQFRPTAPQRLRSVDRTSERSVPPLRSQLGLAAVAHTALADSPASLGSPARFQVSHAAASRGGHLPYYPTAPPLQG